MSHEAVSCPCGSGLDFERLYDARGIYCGKYCEECEAEVRSRYRVDVLEDPSYACEEQIEPD